MDNPDRSTRACLAASLVLIASSAAIAQAPPSSDPPAAAAPQAAPSPLRCEFTVSAWLMGMDGTMGVRGQTVDVSASFGDIVDSSDSIVSYAGRLELGSAAFAGFVDAFYADLEVDDLSGSAGFANVDIEFEQAIVDFGIMFRVSEWKPSGDAAKNPRSYTVDLYAGGRYAQLDVDLQPASLPGVSGGEDWLDPIVGAKLVAPLAEHWHVAINGDIGGFGVESDFTWSATALAGWDFSIGELPASITLGYRAIGWDFTDGAGADEFTWDLVQHGVHFGFSVRL